MKLTKAKEIAEAARRIIAMGAQNVVIDRRSQKRTQLSTCFSMARKAARFALPVYALASTHGTGCTFSAAITAYLLPKGRKSRTLSLLAKKYINMRFAKASPWVRSQPGAPLPQCLTATKFELTITRGGLYELCYSPKSPNGAAVVAVARGLGIPLDLQENQSAWQQTKATWISAHPSQTAKKQSSKMTIKL